MAKLLYSATASLDGYVAGPDGDMSWLTEHVGDGVPIFRHPGGTNVRLAQLPGESAHWYTVGYATKAGAGSGR